MAHLFHRKTWHDCAGSHRCAPVAGLTAIDVAINSRNVAMVRKLETRSQFHSMLLMKVAKWANLGTEWKQRCIALHFPPHHSIELCAQCARHKNVMR